jgi:hypothetical protein
MALSGGCQHRKELGTDDMAMVHGRGSRHGMIDGSAEASFE